MKNRFTLFIWMDDMGTFKQPGCSSLEDALWHVNSARDHDGLRHIDLGDLKSALRHGNGSNEYATFTPEN